MFHNELDGMMKHAEDYKKWEAIQITKDYCSIEVLKDFIIFYNNCAEYDKDYSIFVIDNIEELYEVFEEAKERFKDVPVLIDEEILKTYEKLCVNLEKKVGGNKPSIIPLRIALKTQENNKNQIANIKKHLTLLLEQNNPLDNTTKSDLNKCSFLYALHEHYEEFEEKYEQLHTLHNFGDDCRPSSPLEKISRTWQPLTSKLEHTVA